MLSLASALGSEQFVSLTTFRRSGEGVATPMWIARDGDDLVVMTFASSGKVKRLRRDPHVELRISDRRGRVAPGAPSWTAQATIVDDPAVLADTRARLAAKYGWEYRVVTSVEQLVMRRSGPRVTLRISAPPAP